MLFFDRVKVIRCCFSIIPRGYVVFLNDLEASIRIASYKPIKKLQDALKLKISKTYKDRF